MAASKKNRRATNSRDWQTAGEECLTALLDRIASLVPEIGAADFKLLTEATKVVGEVTGTAIALANPSGEDDGKGDDDEAD